MNRIGIAFLLASLGIGGFGTAAEVSKPAQPEKLPPLVGADGRKIVYYRFGGKQYLETLPAELGRAKEGIKLGVCGKLSSVRESQLALHEPGFQEVAVRLGAGVKCAADAGANLWLGGELRKEGEVRIFLVEAIASLPSDLELF